MCERRVTLPVTRMCLSTVAVVVWKIERFQAMFSLTYNLRSLSLDNVKTFIRCCTTIKATGPSGKFQRLPPGFGRATPFSLYIKENFALRKKEQPTEVFSNLTKEWRNLDEADKKKYVDKAVQISEERRSMFESMSDAEKEELRRRARNLKEARLKRKIRLEKKKQREDNGQRLMSGWMLFVKEKAVKGTADPSRKQQDVIRELAVLWKSLPKSDKDAYIERAKILSESGGISD